MKDDMYEIAKRLSKDIENLCQKFFGPKIKVEIFG